MLIDRRLLAQGISAALDSVVESRRLTLRDFELSKDERLVSFTVGAKRLSFIDRDRLPTNPIIYKQHQP